MKLREIEIICESKFVLSISILKTQIVMQFQFSHFTLDFLLISCEQHLITVIGANKEANKEIM